MKGIILQGISIDDFRMIVREEMGRVSSSPTPTPSSDELMTRKEVLSYLKISAKTLTNWVNDKRLTPIRHGRKVFFKQSEIKKGCANNP